MNRFRTLGAWFFLGGSLWAAPLEEITEKNYPVPPNVSIGIKNTDGFIYIFGAEEPVIKVTARKRAYSKARLDGIAINVKAEGEAVSIETVYPPSPKGLSAADHSGTVDYQILVPQFCTLSQLELVNGEIIIEGLRGPAVNVRLTNGRVMARNCFSDLHLAVANGGIDLLYDWWEALRFAFSAEIGHGSIRALLPSDAALRLDAASQNGSVRSGFSNGEPGSDLHSLKTTIGGEPGARFQFRAASGNIEILKEN